MDILFQALHPRHRRSSAKLWFDPTGVLSTGIVPLLNRWIPIDSSGSESVHPHPNDGAL